MNQYRFRTSTYPGGQLHYCVMENFYLGVWRRIGPAGCGASPEDARHHWTVRMQRAGINIPQGEWIGAMPPALEPVQAVDPTPAAERRTRFFIVRNANCFQPVNDDRVTQTQPGAAPHTTREAAVSGAVQLSSEHRQPLYVYEVRLIGSTEPRDAQFKPVKIVARKAKRKGKKS